MFNIPTDVWIFVKYIIIFVLIGEGQELFPIIEILLLPVHQVGIDREQLIILLIDGKQLLAGRQIRDAIGQGNKLIGGAAGWGSSAIHR